MRVIEDDRVKAHALERLAALERRRIDSVHDRPAQLDHPCRILRRVRILARGDLERVERGRDEPRAIEIVHVVLG